MISWEHLLIFDLIISLIGIPIAGFKYRSIFGWFCLNFFFGFIPFTILLFLPSRHDEVYPQHDTTPTRNNQTKNIEFEELKDLKNLLDNGAITEEEFNKTKQVILENINKNYK